ncbi:catechol-2,3-dioxygenase [Bradyrhizobium sp. USDA 328]
MRCIGCSRPALRWMAPAITRVSEALYLRDPDQNGVELYWDKPREQWPFGPDGKLAMFTKRLDVEGLLKQREG